MASQYADERAVSRGDILEISEDNIADELFETILNLLNSETDRRFLGANAHAVIDSSQGLTKSLLDKIISNN